MKKTKHKKYVKAQNEKSFAENVKIDRYITEGISGWIVNRYMLRHERHD